MKPHQLIVFRAVVETGSLSQAAAEERLAQLPVGYHTKARRRRDVNVIAPIGIVRKNAIMTILFALDAERKEAMAALPGAPPLGIAIIGGPILSQGPTLNSAPAIYPRFDRLASRRHSFPIAQGECRTWFRRINR